METRRIAVGDRSWTVRIDGPQSRHTVVLLPDPADAEDAFDRVIARLHNSELRTVTFETVEGLDATTGYALLDQLDAPWAVLVGNGAGAEVAWQLAARGYGRFIGMVAIGRGHPALADAEGTVSDASCPAVEISTTVVATKRLPRALADGCMRYVYGEFRIAELDTADPLAEADHELATEIVLRTGRW
ncbi:alpha/beta hydrolase [Nocardia sp. alder85J]|uniref:alpha/beta hydrolase n=1 Tax=Nocardia sp. alder85J TaxID=2862949 RepID=UPI001CD61421|nr:alpha/beta hydrolase [Nocardia sp. alder85J]MCX4094232.1 alpha/beta hydrolase [Nocardia sp. alder85J]